MDYLPTYLPTSAYLNRLPIYPPTLQAAPTGGPLKALIFDSYYDSYRGVVVYFRVMDGELRPKDKIRFMASGKEYEVAEVGIMTPEKRTMDVLRAGEVGYLAASIKAVEDARVGDTITLARGGAETPLPGYSEANPMVYAGMVGSVVHWW